MECFYRSPLWTNHNSLQSSLHVFIVLGGHHIGEGEARGVVSVAMCNLTTRCHFILRAGPLTGHKMLVKGRGDYTCKRPHAE